jgi:hypothetical protein
LPTLYQQYKLVIEETIIPALQKIQPLLTSVAEDILALPSLLGFLQNGLPIAVSKNAPLIRHFCSLWQDLLKGVIGFNATSYIIL